MHYHNNISSLISLLYWFAAIRSFTCLKFWTHFFQPSAENCCIRCSQDHNEYSKTAFPFTTQILWMIQLSGLFYHFQNWSNAQYLLTAIHKTIVTFLFSWIFGCGKKRQHVVLPHIHLGVCICEKKFEAIAPCRHMHVQMTVHAQQTFHQKMLLPQSLNTYNSCTVY